MPDREDEIRAEIKLATDRELEDVRRELILRFGIEATPIIERNLEKLLMKSRRDNLMKLLEAADEGNIEPFQEEETDGGD